MKSRMYLAALLAVLVVLVVGCKETSTPQAEPGQRTVIMYMVADNNLSSQGVANLEAMQLGFDPTLGSRLLVFYNQKGGKCSLLEIEAGQKTASDVKVLKEYPSGTNPCLASTVTDVVRDARLLAPASVGYSIMFWSHGTGWLPKGMHPAKVEGRASYSFGSVDSFSQEMEITDLATALPSDMTFEMICFDACYMGCVEVAYELKDRTRYFVGSVAEILAAGIPYQKAMHSILTADATALARCFYDHYNAKSGVWQSATIAVVDCQKLADVASEMALLVQQERALTGGQQFGRRFNRSTNYVDLIWDLGDMVHRTWGRSEAFDAALARAIVYQGATPVLFKGDSYGEIQVNTHSGLSVYIPRLSEPETLAIYKGYRWAKDSGLWELAR